MTFVSYADRETIIDGLSEAIEANLADEFLVYAEAYDAVEHPGAVRYVLRVIYEQGDGEGGASGAIQEGETGFLFPPGLKGEALWDWLVYKLSASAIHLSRILLMTLQQKVDRASRQWEKSRDHIRWA